MPLSNKILLFIIYMIRPIFGPASCRYVFTCTQFAAYQLQKYSFFKAVLAIIKRVLSCNPLF